MGPGAVFVLCEECDGDEGGWRGAGYRDGYDSRGEGGWIGDAAAYDGYDGNRENAADHRGRRDF